MLCERLHSACTRWTRSAFAPARNKRHTFSSALLRHRHTIGEITPLCLSPEKAGIKSASHFKNRSHLPSPVLQTQPGIPGRKGVTHARAHSHTTPLSCSTRFQSEEAERESAFLGRGGSPQGAPLCPPLFIIHSVEVEALLASGRQQALSQECLGGVVGQLEVVGARVHRGEGAV